MSFRHFISDSLTLVSLNHACRNLVSTFPQRSLPWLLTPAACGGLGSAPDRRTRRAHLHLSYSYASPFGPAILVTQPGFDIVYTLSTRHQRFARARLSQTHLTGSGPAFSATLTTAALDRSSLRWFGACP